MSTPTNQRFQRERRDGSSADLFMAPNFIQAVRDSGYVSVSTALAELVDNSIQASATNIDISIDRSDVNAMPEIRVQDDGCGMTRLELEMCLRFGGSSRFDDRASFGRFGMGLPAASLSQSRRVEVTAWTAGNTRPLAVSLDVDEITIGRQIRLNSRRSPHTTTTPSGCLVVWRRCDKIEYRRLVWLERALHRDLGRMYRRHIKDGLRLSINGAVVKSFDPLLLTPAFEGHTSELAFEPLRYELTTSSGETAWVRVRFSVLPVHAWHHLDNATKRRAGVVGGGGVSVLRAGREIAFGWYLMGGKRRENYDDWWRCEIEFDPALDEHFGITINKQGIRPSTELREAVEAELESIARLLNARVRQAFEEVKFQAATEASCRIASAADPGLPVISARGRGKAAGGLSYRITSDQLPPEAMFTTRLRHRTIEVALNVDHPAFNALFQPMQALGEDTTNLRTAVELLLLSFARTTALLDQSGRYPDDLIAAWSNAYGRMLQKS